MSNFVTRAAGAVVFAIAFAGAAQAAPVTVKVADINTLTADGAQVYGARVERAAAKFCAPVRASGGRLVEFHDCLAGVRVEMSEKLRLRNADLAKRGTGTTLAAAD